MSAVDNTKQGDQEPEEKDSLRTRTDPEDERRVEIGFIPYQIEAPEHLAGFPRNILFVKGPGGGRNVLWPRLLLPRPRQLRRGRGDEEDGLLSEGEQRVFDDGDLQEEDGRVGDV